MQYNQGYAEFLAKIDGSLADHQSFLENHPGEVGHAVGLSDEYESPFVDNTMYGYGSMAETKKDTLTGGDIDAATAIYAALQELRYRKLNPGAIRDFCCNPRLRAEGCGYISGDSAELSYWN